MREKNFLVHQHSNFWVCISAPFRLSTFNLIEYVKIKNSFWTLAVFLNVLFKFFCFCKRSKWVTIYEFCRSSFFYFWLTENLFWENFAWRGLGKPKKILDHQLIFLSWWSRKIGHMGTCNYACKRKKWRFVFLFFFYFARFFFPEGMKTDRALFFWSKAKNLFLKNQTSWKNSFCEQSNMCTCCVF